MLVAYLQTTFITALHKFWSSLKESKVSNCALHILYNITYRILYSSAKSFFFFFYLNMIIFLFLKFPFLSYALELYGNWVTKEGYADVSTQLRGEIYLSVCLMKALNTDPVTSHNHCQLKPRHLHQSPRPGLQSF